MYEFAHDYMHDTTTFILFTYMGLLFFGYLIFLVIHFWPKDKS